MPKIRIDEIDLTGRVQQSGISNTVFVPVIAKKAINAKTDGSIDDTKSPFAECSSIDDLVALKDEYFKEDSLDYKLCGHLINIGFIVLIEKCPSVVDSAGKYIPEKPHWSLLADKGVYDVRFLTEGIINCTHSDMKSTAEKRGDCIALFNFDTSKIITEKDPETEEEITINFSWKADILRKFIDESSSYAAMFAPNFYTINSDFVDTTAEKIEPVEIPASYGYLFAYANMRKNNPEWYSVAGYERGIIPELSGVVYDYNSAEIEILQARGVDGAVDLPYFNDAADFDKDDSVTGVAINPIANIRPAGYIIYGNRTLKKNDAKKRTTASSFLNVRNMVSAIKKNLYNASRIYTFEQNNDVLWFNFQSYNKPLLEQMKYGNGLAGYKFTRVATNAKARLKARLTIIPIEAVEDFQLMVELADSLEIVE